MQQKRIILCRDYVPFLPDNSVNSHLMAWSKLRIKGHTKKKNLFDRIKYT